MAGLYGRAHCTGVHTADMPVQSPGDATATFRRTLWVSVYPVARPGRSAAQPMEDLASRAQPAWPLARMETVLVRRSAVRAALKLPCLTQRSVLSHHSSHFTMTAHDHSLMHAGSTPPVDDGCGGFGEPACGVPRCSALLLLLLSAGGRATCHVTLYMTKQKVMCSRLTMPAQVGEHCWKHSTKVC